MHKAWGAGGDIFVCLTPLPFEVKNLIFHHSLLSSHYFEFVFAGVSCLFTFFTNTTSSVEASGQKGHFCNVGNFCIWVTSKGH